MVFSPEEQTYVAAGRVGRLATSDPDGDIHVVPVCYALVSGRIVTPLDEKPKSVPVEDLQRVRNIRSDPRVGFVADHYRECWNDLGWVQVRGRGKVRLPGGTRHAASVVELREKYSQYENHRLVERPVIEVTPETVVSWGCLDPSPVT